MKEVKIVYCETVYKSDNRTKHEHRLTDLLNNGWRIEGTSTGGHHLYVVLVRDN